MTTFDFAGELNDFLAPEKRHRGFAAALTRRASVKDVIEALGVPHTEVGAIRIDGAPAALDHVLDAEGHAHVAVEPNGRGHASRLRAPLPRPPRFVLDTHLGTLARYLRLIGLDTRYANDCDDARLAAISARDTRILLTRDRGLLKRARVVFARFIRQDDPLEQLADVFVHFELAAAMQPFSRCAHCNQPLEHVNKAAIVHRLEPGTRRHFHRFKRCPGCARLYWRGSHHSAMQARIDALLAHLT